MRCILKECKSRSYFYPQRPHACSKSRNSNITKNVRRFKMYSIIIYSCSLTYNFRDEKNIKPKYFGYTSGI
ncbi:hypothetical protein HZS_6064 [Henneguya salminicola]|nr:hypothetical protein HZS_6064 [Henneguya salminicola]